MVERADIAQLLISRQGKFFPGEFLMAVHLQHLRTEFVVNRPGANFTFGLTCESAMRPLMEANQALGLKSAKIMRSGETKSVSGWLLKQLMRILPGPVTEWLISRGTERIIKAANAICLKDYSSFLRSKEAPG